MTAGASLTLVTGFPRQIARLITAELVARGERVALLARPRHLDEARRFVAEVSPEGAAEVVEGDVTSIDLGLSGAEYLALTERVTAVHHAAVATPDASDPRLAAHLNEQGARELLLFARERRGAPPRLVYYGSVASAAGVRDRVPAAPLLREALPRDPVAASLRRAESLLARAWEDVPSTLLRVATVVGHSETGEVDLLDGLYLLVLLMMSAPREIAVPLPLRETATLNVVPVDHVARVGVALAASPQAAGRVLHVVDPAPLSARRGLELLSETVVRRAPRGMVPVNITRALLRTPGMDRLVKSPRAFAERFAGRAHYEGDLAATLGAVAPRCPSFESYVDALVDHVRDRLARSPVVGDAVAEVDDDPLY